MSLVLFKLPIHPRLSLGTFVGNVKIEVFDWLVESLDKRVAKSPAGYLVKSITDDYALPKGFVPKAERQRREEARQAKEREAAAERRRKHEEEARERAEKKAINAYWESLTPEQQAELDAAAAPWPIPKRWHRKPEPSKNSGRQSGVTSTSGSCSTTGRASPPTRRPSNVVNHAFAPIPGYTAYAGLAAVAVSITITPMLPIFRLLTLVAETIIVRYYRSNSRRVREFILYNLLLIIGLH